MTCQRCGTETISHTMSRFNEQEICPLCEQREKKHPMYGEAARAESAAVRNGDYNFPGIGLPADLVVGKAD